MCPQHPHIPPHGSVAESLVRRGSVERFPPSSTSTAAQPLVCHSVSQGGGRALSSQSRPTVRMWSWFCCLQSCCHPPPGRRPYSSSTVSDQGTRSTAKVGQQWDHAHGIKWSDGIHHHPNVASQTDRQKWLQTKLGDTILKGWASAS